MHTLLVLASATFGAFFTGLLSQVYEVPVVRSSSLSSLILAVTLQFFPVFDQVEYNQLVAIVFFGASFNGMTSKSVLPLGWLTVSGFFFGLLFLVSSRFFTGFGGGLGTTACLSVLIGLSLKQGWAFIYTQHRKKKAQCA